MPFVVELVPNLEWDGTLHALQKCLDLRDKYMSKSLQRLGDNPRDHDGRSQPGDPSALASSEFEPWKIYPPPPPPHWHWTDKDKVMSSADGVKRGRSEFRFEECHIPGPHSWTFELDDKGVYQVYDDIPGEWYSSSLL